MRAASGVSRAQGLQLLSGPVQISAAREHCDVALAAVADSAPIRERCRVQNFAFKRTGFLETRSHPIHASDIAGDRVQLAFRSFSEAGDLRRRRIQQLRADDVGIQAVDFSAVAGADQRLSIRIECDGIDDVLRIRPDFARRAIGIDAIDFRSAGDRRRAAWRMLAAAPADADSRSC